LRKLGLNVELQAGDWGTLITRRTSKEPVEKGGWSIFHTWLVGPDMLSPANMAMVNLGEKSWFGWPADPKLEELRQALVQYQRCGRRQKGLRCRAARSLQLRPVHHHGPVHPARGLPVEPVRMIIAPVTFLWNVEKK